MPGDPAGRGAEVIRLGDGAAAVAADGGGGGDQGGAAALEDRERGVQPAEEQRHAVGTRLQYRPGQAEGLLPVAADRPPVVALGGEGEPAAAADGGVGADGAGLVRQLGERRQAAVNPKNAYGAERSAKMDFS